MKACAILLNYKRPTNIERIVQQLCAVNSIDKIIISNNNPDVPLDDYFTLDDYPIEVINQTNIF